MYFEPDGDNQPELCFCEKGPVLNAKPYLKLWKLIFRFSPLILIAVVPSGLLYGFLRMPGSQDPAPSALTQPQVESKQALLTHVRMLSHKIGERNNRTPRALKESGDYIERQVQEIWSGNRQTHI